MPIAAAAGADIPDPHRIMPVLVDQCTSPCHSPIQISNILIDIR